MLHKFNMLVTSHVHQRFTTIRLWDIEEKVYCKERQCIALYHHTYRAVWSDIGPTMPRTGTPALISKNKYKTPCSLCHQVVNEIRYHYDICSPCPAYRDGLVLEEAEDEKEPDEFNSQDDVVEEQGYVSNEEDSQMEEDEKHSVEPPVRSSASGNVRIKHVSSEKEKPESALQVPHSSTKCSLPQRPISSATAPLTTNFKQTKPQQAK